MLENFSKYPGALEVYQEFRSIGSMINESKLDQNQVKQIFQAVADGYQKGEYKYNSELYGKDADKSKLYKKIYAAYDKVKHKIASSSPIRGFDVSFDKIQKDLLSAAGGDDGKIGRALAKLREFGTKNPKIQSAVIYALAIAAGTFGGFGVVGVLAGLRVVERLVKGDKLSTAVWTGIKTMAMGSLAAGVTDFLNPEEITSTGKHEFDTELDDTIPSEGSTEYSVEKGDTLSNIAQDNDLSVKELLAANPDITHVDQIRAGETITIPDPTGSTVYDAGVGTAADTAKKVASGEYTNRWNTYESIIDHKKTSRMKEIRESFKMPGEKIYLTAFGVSVLLKEAANLNEGIWDSIKGAFKSGKAAAKDPISYETLDLNWRKNYKDQTAQGSVDSDEVIKFLTKMGVEKAAVDNAMDSIVKKDDDTTNRGDITNKDDTTSRGNITNKDDTTSKDDTTPIDPEKKDKQGFSMSYKDEYVQKPGEYGYWDAHSRDMKPGNNDGTNKNQQGQQTNTPTPRQSATKNDYTVVNNYVKNVATALKQAPNQDAKIKLVKELVNFMADRQGTPEWDNASGTVKQILKTSGINGNTIQNAIQRHQQGKMMESFQYMFITGLLKEMNMTFEQLGLVETIIETNNGKSFIVESIEDIALREIKRLIK